MYSSILTISLQSFDAPGSEYTAERSPSWKEDQSISNCFDNNPEIRKSETNKAKHVNETLAACYLKVKNNRKGSLP